MSGGRRSSQIIVCSFCLGSDTSHSRAPRRPPLGTSFSGGTRLGNIGQLRARCTWGDLGGVRAEQLRIDRSIATYEPSAWIGPTKPTPRTTTLKDSNPTGTLHRE